MVVLAVLLLPTIAAAHPIKGVGDFYAGMLHPLTSLEFVVPWIALALFAGRRESTPLVSSSVFSPASILLGAVLALTFPQPTWLAVPI